MRKLAYTADSPQSIKLGDSNDVLSLRVTELDQPVDLSKVSSITVKIGNTLGFLTEINVAVSSLLHPTDGRIDVAITSKISSELPAGQYLLEVWIDDAQGNTAIYPDTSYPSVIGFSIKKNIMTATSTVITTLTLADFEAKFDNMQKDLQNKVTSGYFKGDKGDTGSVDNDGLINSQAFQSLKSQIDNSAVGTNLLTGSQGPFTPDSSPSNYDNAIYTNITGYFEKGITYTISASSNGNFTDDHEPNTESDNIVLWLTNATLDNSESKFSYIVSSSTTGTTGTTFTWRQPSAYASIRVNAYHKESDMEVDHIKIEKGSKATDWCPNPSEILTQSDYDKIKAAIVALGGALS